MAWVKFGVFAHLFVGSIMLSNKVFFPSKKDEEEELSGESYEFDVDDKNMIGFFISDYFSRL